MVGFFRASQARIEAEEARILTDPRHVHRVRRLRSLAGMIDAEIGQLERNAGRFLTDVMPTVYAAGAQQVGLGFGWTQVHRQALQRLAEDSYDDVLAATTHMRADAKRWIRETSRRLTAEGHIEGYTPVQLARRMARLGPQAATVAGMPSPITAVVYANGARQTIGTYGEMLFRTKTAVAFNTGTITRAREAGITRFEIFDGSDCGLRSHDDPDKANGMIVTAEQAAAWPIAHPNCRRSFGARPDLEPAPGADPAEIGRDVGANDPTPTEAQQQDQADSEGAVRSPRQARQRRADIRAGQQERWRQEAAAEIEAAKRRAAELVTSDHRARAGRASARARAVREHGPLLDHHGVTPEQFVRARRQLSEIRTQIRADAGDLSARLNDSLITLSKPPRRVRKVDPVTSRVRWTRGAGGEWDWFDELDPAEQVRIRRTRFRDGGEDPTGLRLGLESRFADADEALDDWLDRVRRADTAARLKSGRLVDDDDLDRLFRGESQTAIDVADRGLSLDAIMTKPEPEAAALLARSDLDVIVRYADDVFRVETGQPAPWDMTISEYVEELGAFFDPRFEPIAARAARGEALSDGEEYLVQRFGELVPGGLDLEAQDMVASYEQIRHVAREAGLLSADDVAGVVGSG